MLANKGIAYIAEVARQNNFDIALVLLEKGYEGRHPCHSTPRALTINKLKTLGKYFAIYTMACNRIRDIGTSCIRPRYYRQQLHEEDVCIVTHVSAKEDKTEIWDAGDTYTESIYSNNRVTFPLESSSKREAFPPPVNLDRNTGHIFKECFPMPPEGGTHECITSKHANTLDWRPKSHMREALIRTIDAYQTQNRGDPAP